MLYFLIMKKKILFFVFLLLQLFSFNSLAQDQILLLNGKNYNGKLLGNSPDIVNFDFISKSGKTKSFSFENNRVYSFTKEGEEESVLYKKDTSIYHYFSQYEMRMFIYGEKDAYDRSSVAKPWISGFAVGLGVSMYDTYLSGNYVCTDNQEVPGGFFKRQPSLAQFIIPFVVPIVAGVINPKMKAKHASDPTFLANEQYIDGFKKVRRFKRVKSSLFGSLCGVAVGMLAYTLSPKPCQ